MKKFAALLLVVLLAVSFVSISAQEKEAPKAGHCKSTALDSETKVQVEKLKLQYKLTMVDLNAEKETIQKGMMEELLKEETSPKAIEKLGKSMNALQYKMHQAKIDYVLSVKAVLPAEHWEGFLMKQHAAGMGCQKACCAKSAGCEKAAGCAKSAGMCSMEGEKGHKCTEACKTSDAGAGCATPCAKTKK
jgi:hypothetical protein